MKNATPGPPSSDDGPDEEVRGVGASGTCLCGAPQSRTACKPDLPADRFAGRNNPPAVCAARHGKIRRADAPRSISIRQPNTGPGSPLFGPPPPVAKTGPPICKAAPPAVLPDYLRGSPGTNPNDRIHS